MVKIDHTRSATSCADLLINNPLFKVGIPLADYLTRQPDELSLHYLVLTKAALDCDDDMYREVLLFALIERQICLAKALDALLEQDIGQFDN